MINIDRMLLVGLGSIGKRHLVNLQRLMPTSDIMVLRSRAGDELIEGCRVVSSLQAALDFKPQVAFLCNPASAHIKIAAELARAGIHLFIEKPLSHLLAGLDQFESIVRESNITAMVGYNLRFNRSLCALKQILSNRQYGRCLHVVAEVGQYLPDWRPDSDYRATVSAKAELGGGALLELSHELDYLCWLFGEPVEARGQLSKISDLDIDVEDLVQAHVRFEKNTIPVTASIHLDFLQRKAYRSCRVVCEEATLIWNAIEDRVEVHQAEGTTIAFQGDKVRNDTYDQEMLAFFESVKNNTKSLIPIEDGVRVMRLVEAIRQSSESGKVVRL
jgi:predicted dehydrogenase